MADGTITFATDLDNAQLEKKLAKTTASIENLEQKIENWKNQKIPLVEQSAKIAANLDAAKAKLAEMQANKPNYSSEAIADQKTLVAGLQREYNRTENSIDRINASISDGTLRVGRMREEAGELHTQLSRSAKGGAKMGTAIQTANKKMDQFLARVKKLAARAFVFSLISRGLRSMISWFGKAITANDEARAAIARLKGALLTLAQPILDVVIPALTLMINVLTRVITLIMRLFDALFGSSFLSGSKKSAKALREKMSAIDGVGASAKKAAKYLAGFDEINAMSDDSDSGGGGGNSGGIGADFGFDTNTVTSKLDEIAVYAAGALLALGVVLTFTGANIPLGLGLIAIGALTLAAEVKEDWGAMGNGVTEAINIVLGILASAGLVIGAILAFTGANLPLGIGLMIMGAAALGSEIVLNWDTIKRVLQGPMGGLAAMISAAVLVLGAILAFSGAALPLGIALMVAGAAALGTTAALNWDKVKGELTGANAEIYAQLSGALLVIGALMTFSGANLPLGIGLMVAGVAGLATVTALNWNSIVASIQGPVGEIIAIASGALLVLGVMLTCAGILPLGIGLIIAGVAGLATVTALNWNSILYKIKGVWNSIKSFWNAYIAPIFTLKWWKDLAIKCGNGLISGFEAAINGIISLFEMMINWIVSGLNKISFDVPDWVPGIGGKKFGFNLSEVSFDRVAIPRLAQGAVIPPNREFMAVLGDQKHGTNVEAPLETIQEAVALVMDDMINSNLAGQEAILGVLREILQAILGIEIGDDIIGRAVDRYNRKRAVMRGV